MAANIPEDHRGNAQSDGYNPSQDNNHVCLVDSALVLRPNWKHDRDTAVDTDDNQEEDAAEHVEEHDGGGELAHEAAKGPLLHHHVGDAEREEGAEDEVRDCEAQVPGGVDRLLHLEARNPDDQGISAKAQQKNEHTDHQQRHAKDFPEARRLVLENMPLLWSIVSSERVVIV